MAESELRRQKRTSLAAASSRLTPAGRVRRASMMTDAGIKLRAAGRRIAAGSRVHDAPDGRGRSPFRDLAAVLGILRELRLPHALIGGWAVVAWGSLRTSEDIDLMIELPPSRRKRLLSALSSDYEAAWIPGGEDDPIPGLVRARPRARNAFPIDFLPARNRQDRAALSRAVGMTAEGATIPIVRPEDLIAMKLEAGGGQDYEDARRLLSILTGKLDGALLKETIAARRVEDRLALLRR